MSEISRSDAIDILKDMTIEISNGDTDTWSSCGYQHDATVKAISDMEKLEKIEALYEPRAFGEYPSSYEDIAKEIWKIVKEGAGK